MDDAAVLDADDPVRELGDLLVVGNHHNGLAELLARHLEQREHVLAGFAVQVAGRLVRQYDGGLGGERAGDGHALLLAARKLAGQIGQLAFQPQRADDLVHIGAIDRAAVQLDGEYDIFVHAQYGNKIIRLEHEPDAPAAENGQLVVLQREDVVPVHIDLAVRRAVQPAEHVQQGGFARAGCADHRDEFAVFDRKVHAVERAHLGIARAVNLAQGLCL